MEGDFITIKKSLLPLSWIYGLAVKVRNFFFDVGVLKSRSFQMPVISVGNITVGGTVKTPHVEYLIRLLHQSFKVAVLSRGYKRKKKGFIVADDGSKARDIGDEPYQMKRKFPDVTVAVDKKRVHGIELLTKTDDELDVVLLDDAYQHRYVKPGVNILLVDYHRMIMHDKLLPAGRLREPEKGKSRADIVIVTKCPRDMKPMEFRVITKAMGLFPFQNLFFTMLDYGELQPLFPEAPAWEGPLNAVPNVLLLTGIASPRQLQEDLAPMIPNITLLSFPDHHDFRWRDVERIASLFLSMPSPKIIITTEKDAARLINMRGLDEDVRKSLYVLPVHIRFMQQQQEEQFNEIITSYVRKNSRDSILAKRKDDHKSHDGYRPGDGARTISFRNN